MELWWGHCKEIQPVHSEGDQPWDFFGRNDAQAETPLLWPPPAKSWFIGKDSDAGRDWGQEEKGTTGWDGWMASLTRWMWVWVNSGSWWWTGRPGVLRFMGSQRAGQDWATELNWTVVNNKVRTRQLIWLHQLWPRLASNRCHPISMEHHMGGFECPFYFYILSLNHHNNSMK